MPTDSIIAGTNAYQESNEIGKNNSMKDQAEKLSGNTITTTENSRGIPACIFIENIELYLSKSGTDVEAILKHSQTLYGKYKFMESQLIQQQRQLLTKIPDIEKAIQAINLLIKKKEDESEVECRFELADSLFATAKVDPTQDHVLLWLGANVMLEYNYTEASELLNANLTSAQSTLKQLQNDLMYLKDQITISEVNIARLHNYKVSLKNHKNSEKPE